MLWSLAAKLRIIDDVTRSIKLLVKAKKYNEIYGLTFLLKRALHCLLPKFGTMNKKRVKKSQARL